MLRGSLGLRAGPREVPQLGARLSHQQREGAFQLTSAQPPSDTRLLRAQSQDHLTEPGHPGPGETWGPTAVAVSHHQLGGLSHSSRWQIQGGLGQTQRARGQKGGLGRGMTRAKVWSQDPCPELDNLQPRGLDPDEGWQGKG